MDDKILTAGIEDQNNVLDESEKDDSVKEIQYDITSFGADYDVEGLVKRFDREDIYIPPFQRSFVWSQKEASRFIESLLLGLPVPGIFLAREQNTKKLIVIDGQQRLKSLQFYYNGFFNPKPNEQKLKVFKLLNVQKKFEGRTYNELEDEDRILLNDSIIHSTIVKQESPPEEDGSSIYHIFERLNSTGRKLSPHQIRVAVYHGKLIDLINELNKYNEWREIYGKESPTLKDQELILRFFALYYDRKKYKRPMKEFLNEYTDRNRNLEKSRLNELKEIFTSTITLLLNAIGKKAFRPERALNAAVFDSIMVGVADFCSRNVERDIAKIKTIYSKLINDENYLKAISQSTSDEKNVEFRLNMTTKRFKKLH